MNTTIETDIATLTDTLRCDMKMIGVCTKVISPGERYYLRVNQDTGELDAIACPACAEQLHWLTVV